MFLYMFKHNWAWIKLATDNFNTVLTRNLRNPRDYAPLNITVKYRSTCKYTMRHICMFSLKQLYTLHFYICLKRILSIAILKRSLTVRNDVMFLYLIVPFWYASAAYQASLVELWFVFWRDAVEILVARPNEPDVLPKRTKKGAIRYLPYPNSS